MASLAVAVGAGTSLFSAQSEVDALIEVLIEEGLIPAQRADVIRQRVAEKTAPPEDAESPPISRRFPGVQYEPTERLRDEPVKTQVRRFGVETADGTERFRIRGRLMVDGALVGFSTEDTVDDERDGQGNIARHGTIIRRARLGVLGVIANDWEYQMEVDFRDAEIRFANSYIAYLGLPGSRLAIGNFKEPFSMESSTSSRRITFIERATPIDAYRPDRELGILYETVRPRHYLAAGVFGGDGVVRNREIHEGYSLALRGSFAPYYGDSNWMHIGAFANYRKNAFERLANGNKAWNDVRLRSRLGTRAVDARFIGRRDLEDVQSLTRYGLEFAAGFGSSSIQAEYVKADADLDRPDVDNVKLDGYYIQFSHYLTGEQRNYRPESGDIGRTPVLRPFSPGAGGGPGAWEVAARFSHTDSTDAFRVTNGGQKMDHWTLGLNWFPTSDIIFKFNYIYLDAYSISGRGNEFEKNTSGSVYALRAQYEF